MNVTKLVAECNDRPPIAAEIPEKKRPRPLEVQGAPVPLTEEARDEEARDPGEKPVASPVFAANSPRRFRDKPKWVAWEFRLQGGGWKKVPINPCTGENAKINDASTWATFDEALAFYREHGADG